jgi:aerobic-type carbon monoxide dehydrogenase small subunit (CoxS/CutS family)
MATIKGYFPSNKGGYQRRKMSEEEKKSGLSRREFLKDAGLVVGGATIGSMAFLSSCKSTTTTTDTVSTTITKPPVTTTVSKFIDPIDGTEWPTLADLQSHFAIAHPQASIQNLVTLNINGVDYTLQVNEMDTLAFILRDKLGLFGTKVACEMGQCGACTVLVDDIPTFACLVLAIEAGGKKVTTIEALSNGTLLSPIQQKFYDNDAFQCGYCTGGFIMAGQGLVKANPKPTADDVRLAISGHICVCGNYKKVVDAITGGV